MLGYGVVKFSCLRVDCDLGSISVLVEGADSKCIKFCTIYLETYSYLAYVVYGLAWALELSTTLLNLARSGLWLI